MFGLLSARSRHGRFRPARLLPLLLVAFLSAGCGSHSAQSERRYHLHGKVVSVDVKQGFAQIDSDAIPGFMDRMTMPYQIPDASALATLRPGDEITADLVLTDEGDHLEHISIVKHGSEATPARTRGAPPPSSSFQMPQAGDKVPDVVVINESGRALHLRGYRGKALFVTFIYTRCPFAEFCPKVSHNFAEIYAAIEKQPTLASKVRLLSISFDTKNDTPAALRSYAASFREITGTAQPFPLWEFATAQPKELPRMAKFFGLYYSFDEGQIIHSMSTSLISPDGRVVEWFHDNDWQPARLVADAAKAVLPPEHANTRGRSKTQNNGEKTGSNGSAPGSLVAY
jgi:protein SCO1/2